ncbi:DUF1353 domain-containing protein [Brevundimonas sp.]|uniref:DUF1353 domain-containing protein n=1 Tax=Brevundimonas sp. TaxID=1871086 RepID=UPI0025C64928|nr:DUF1353 domain-containing protein [Brevundimonas sp.]MCG2663353.1 DUF1353 domain-containing protein [Brevundimonas sp.]
MISFVTQGPRFELTSRREHGRAVWRVLEPIILRFLLVPTPLDTPRYFMIPAGFETDGASIPWWARWKFDPWGRVGLAAVLHDYLLSLPNVRKWEADLAFLAALRSQGAPAFMATLFYFAVRLRRPVPVSTQGASND